MSRTIFTPIAPATLTIAEELLSATWDANAAEPYVASDYDAVADALLALLVGAFGKEDGEAARQATYDTYSVREAIAAVQADTRAAAADAYDVATARQAEADALAAFDALAAGQGDPATHLRTFAAATDHLATIGAGLSLDGTWMDRDATDAAVVAAARLTLADAHVAPCGEPFGTGSDAEAHRVTCGACAGAEEAADVVAVHSCHAGTITAYL